MSAKHSKKSAKPSPAIPASANLTPAPASAGAGASAAATDSSASTVTPWIDSADPRKRTLGKIVLVAVWLYVAALGLLALDQTFGWGIFGPKVPPVP